MGALQIPRLPKGTTPFERELVRTLEIALSDMVRSINQSATGQLAAWSSVSDTKPTHVGSPGDTVRNTNNEPLGSLGSTYMVDGWRWSSTDNLWHEISHLTDG